MNKGIIIGGVILLVGAASAPYFLGNAIEKEFTQGIKSLQASLHNIDPNLSIKQENYQKGWFSSSSRVILTYDGIELPIDNQISHGPFSHMGLGKIQSTIVLSKNKAQPQEKAQTQSPHSLSGKNYSVSQSAIDLLFSGQSPLVVTTQIGFSNNLSFTIFSPTIDNKPFPNDPTSIINWSGANGTITLNGQHSTTHIVIPHLKLNKEKKFFELNNIVLNATGLFGNDFKRWKDIDTSEKASLSVDKLAFDNGISTFSSKIDLTWQTTDNQKDLGLDTTLKLTELELPKNVKFELSKDAFIEAKIGFTNIPKQQLIDYLMAFDDLQKRGRTPTEAELTTIVEPFLFSYLRGTPSAQANLTLKDSNKNASLSIVLTLPATDPNAKTIEQVITSVQDRLEVTLLSITSVSFLEALEKNGLLPMPKEALIRELQQRKAMTLSNGELSTKTEYKKGHFYVNGQPNPELDNSLPYLLQSLY